MSTTGRVVATLDDYAAVRELFGEAFGAAQQDGLTRAQRDAVRAVCDLCVGSLRDAGVSLTAVSDRLGLDKSAAQRRLANPLKQGYVANLETRKGMAARYVPGEQLPAEVSALPEVEALEDGPTPPATVQHCNTPGQNGPNRDQNGPFGTVAATVADPNPDATVGDRCSTPAGATPTATPPRGANRDQKGVCEGEPLQRCSVAGPSGDGVEPAPEWAEEYLAEHPDEQVPV